MLSEKAISSSPPVHKRPKLVWGVLLVILLFVSGRPEVARSLCGIASYPSHLAPESTPDVCPQADALFPTRNADIWKTASDHFKLPVHAIDLLAGAVQIPCVVPFVVV